MRLALSLDLQNQGAASDVQLRAPVLARFLCDWPWQNSHDHSIGRQSASTASSRDDLSLHAVQVVTCPDGVEYHIDFFKQSEYKLAWLFA